MSVSRTTGRRSWRPCAARTLPSVLVAHSGGGAVATAALDTTPDSVRRVIYVDSGPVSDGHIPRPDLPADVVEIDLPPLDEMDAMGASLDGLDDNARQRFQDWALPHPAGTLREPIPLRDPRRNDTPATMICCSITSDTVRQLAAAGSDMFAPVAQLNHVTFVDLPTGHWPMWSRPIDLADAISAAARD
ncbi:alpha/beta fold hydrolase [Spiractinospora alimapuensis]|uniref:alpha/beta fold hydrolase n=1 Tax=Spiractinospora alimapuensis TaxID=2820884 RepID=UPI002ED2429C